MVRLPKHFADEIVAHARDLDPIECTGVVAGAGGEYLKRYPMTNVANSPFRFSWDPKEMLKVYLEMEDKGWEDRIVYHSHTRTQAHPSQTDVRLAGWPEAHYLIVSLQDRQKPVLRVFRIIDGAVTEEPLEIV